MANAFVAGLNSIQTRANLGDVGTRYNLFLRNTTWLSPVLTGAAHKMFGDLCRDTLELFTKYELGGVKQEKSGILANNDRPAQAMATFMAAALDDANASGSCWATDTSGKDPDQVMAVWGVRGVPTWTQQAKLMNSSIAPGAAGAPPPIPDYKDVAPILLAALDGIHDFVPSATFLQKLAAAFNEPLAGGGKAGPQKGGDPELERNILAEEIDGFAAANAIIMAIDQTLEVEGGVAGFSKIYVGGAATNTYGYVDEKSDAIYLVTLSAEDGAYISPLRMAYRGVSQFPVQLTLSTDPEETIIVPAQQHVDFDTVPLGGVEFGEQLFGQLSENSVSALEAKTVESYLDAPTLEGLHSIYVDYHARIREALSIGEIDTPYLFDLLGIEVPVPDRVGAGERADIEEEKNRAIIASARAQAQKEVGKVKVVDMRRLHDETGGGEEEEGRLREGKQMDARELLRKGFRSLAEKESRRDVSTASRKYQRLAKFAEKRGLPVLLSSGGDEPVFGGGKRRTMKNKSKSKRNAKNQTHRKRKGKAVGKRTATAHRPKTARNAKKIAKKRTSNTKTKRSAKPAKKRAINRRARNARKNRK